MPESRRLNVLDRILTLEKGILSGALLVLAGFVLLGYAFLLWSKANFGMLDVNEVVRIVICSSLSISMGFQIVLSSFLLGTLRLSVRANLEPSVGA